MKPRLLMLTPTAPDEGGVGLQRRAAAILGCLSESFEVYLVIVPLNVTERGPFVTRHASRAMVLDAEAVMNTHLALTRRLVDAEARSRAMANIPLPWMARFSTPAAARSIVDWLGSEPLDAIHVHRLFLAPLAVHLMQLGQRPKTMVLDLDDDEVVAHHRLAALAARNGDPIGSAALDIEARKFAALAGSHLPLFDVVTVCSQADRSDLGARYPDARVSVLPNTYPCVSERAKREPRSGTLRLLFVGALDFAPNIDAVMFLCLRLLPTLRARSDRPVELLVAGRNPPDALKGICETAGARLFASPEDIAPLYRAADIALVPIRAAGGTRIKILEAFAYGVPVISTAIGAEGLEVTGQHLVICDLDEFAAACLDLNDDPEKADAMRQAARRLVETHYSPAVLKRRLEEIYQDDTGEETGIRMGLPGSRDTSAR